MALLYGWKQSSVTSNLNVINSSSGDPFAEDIDIRQKKTFLKTLCRRPTLGLTEVRRDGKDNLAVAKVIRKEFLIKMDTMEESEFINHMRDYASACWATMESVHQQFLKDEQPENERARMDPDHWFEINLTNATLFSNLYLEKVEGLEQLVPGRFFSTRMPRDIMADLGERNDFIKKCKKNKLEVILVLTEPFEFKKDAGMDNLLEFYKQECNLIVYNRAIPDFQLPTCKDLVLNIMDLVYHLSYDSVARIRKVKSTYVETKDQEMFLKYMPKAIDKRVIQEKPQLARAIAAEHLIQVFFTHKDKIGKANTKEDKDAVRQRFGDVMEPLDQEEEDEILEAYRQTFDLIDQDNSGTLEHEELDEWFAMCGAELDLSSLTEVLFGDGVLTRDRFAELMRSEAKPHRRDYNIGDEEEGQKE